MRKHNSQLVANWFFPMETRFAASEDHDIPWESTMVANWFLPWKSGLLILQRSCMIYGRTQFATGCELVFFQWKRGLLLHEITIFHGESTMVANWFFPWKSGFADSAKIMHDIWENTIRNWLRIGFFQWKRGLLLLHEITICNWLRIGVCIYIYIYLYIALSYNI